MYQVLLTNVFGLSDYYMRLARHVKNIDKLSPEQYAVVQARNLTVADCVRFARYHRRQETTMRHDRHLEEPPGCPDDCACPCNCATKPLTPLQQRYLDIVLKAAGPDAPRVVLESEVRRMNAVELRQAIAASEDDDPEAKHLHPFE